MEENGCLGSVSEQNARTGNSASESDVSGGGGRTSLAGQLNGGREIAGDFVLKK